MRQTWVVPGCRKAIGSPSRDAGSVGVIKEDARMVLRNGREFLSIPGPTTVPDEVLSAMHRPALDIYGSEMLDLTAGCLSDLRKIFSTAGNSLLRTFIIKPTLPSAAMAP